MQKVIVIGDTHGKWKELNAINRYFQRDIAIIVDDLSKAHKLCLSDFEDFEEII